MIISLKKIKKAAAFIFAGLLVLSGILFVIFNFWGNEDQSQADSNIYPDNYSRVAFLNLCGLKVDEENFEEKQITIPYEFNQTYQNYNELQKAQGYDLSGFKGLNVTQFTYAVENYPGGHENIVAVLLIYENRIIGGDVHSLEISGFMTGLKDETLY